MLEIGEISFIIWLLHQIEIWNKNLETSLHCVSYERGDEDEGTEEVAE